MPDPDERSEGGIQPMGNVDDLVPRPRPADPVRVLSIAGTAQNGATILSRLLGTLDGFVAVGELGYLWRALAQDALCGCGRPFRACPFWQDVGEEAYGGWDSVDPEHASRLRRAVAFENRRLPQIAALPLIRRPGLSSGYRETLRRYSALLEPLYRAIHTTSGGKVIVDSMKQPSHPYLLATLPTLDVRVVHLVRDPRGVAYSGTRVVQRVGAPSHEFRGRRTPLNSAVRWNLVNGAYRLLPRLGTETMTVRYEALVRSPRDHVVRIADFAGAPVDPAQLGFIGEGAVQLGVDHMPFANRVRLQGERLTLRADQEWQAQMGDGDRRLVSALTWPMRRQYGY
jgi:Sulfotransferase family